MKKLLTVLTALFTATCFGAAPAFQRNSATTNDSPYIVAGSMQSFTNGPVALVRPDGTVTNMLGTTEAIRGYGLTNALVLAAAGDTIYMWGGSATLNTGTTNALGKTTGLRYWFGPGVYIGKPDGRVIYDRAAAMDIYVDGGANLASTDTALGNKVIDLNNGATKAFITVNSITNFGPSGAAGVYMNNGYLNLMVKDTTYSSNYDGIWIDGGITYISSKRIIAGDNGLEITGGTNEIIFSEMICAGPALNITGGTNVIKGNTILGVGQSLFLGASVNTVLDVRRLTGGLRYNAGNLRLINCAIEGTVRAGTGTGFVLENCSISTADSLAITSAVASVVNVIGTLNLNGKGVGTNITLATTSSVPAISILTTNYNPVHFIPVLGQVKIPVISNDTAYAVSGMSTTVVYRIQPP